LVSEFRTDALTQPNQSRFNKQDQLDQHLVLTWAQRFIGRCVP